MSAGINSCAQLTKIQLAVDNVWADNAKNKDYIANVEAIKAIKENQTVQFTELTNNPTKDKTVTLYWTEFCNAAVKDCTDQCLTAGTEPGTICQDYTLGMCKEIEFSVREKAYRTLATTFEEAVAVSLLANLKKLDEYVAQQVVAKIVASVGVNQYTQGKGVVSGFKTKIQPAYWGSSLIPYFKLVASKNKFNNPYLLSGTNLYESVQLAIANSGNSDGKGAANLFSQLPIYFDIFNVDDATPNPSAFLLNKNAIAFISKAYFGSLGTPESIQYDPATSVGQRYKISSKNISGLEYDVVYKVVCSGNDVIHNWKIMFTGDIFRNPVGCNLNNTNILQFECAS
jgi:hypothetical protein